MIVAWVLTILAWVAFLLSEWAGFSPAKWPIVSNPIFEKVAFGLAIIFTLRAIFWLPFRRHEKLVAELDATKPQPPKIKAPPAEPTRGNQFERSVEGENGRKGKTLVAELEARNQPPPPNINTLPPEQKTGNRFERLNAVVNASESKARVAEPEARNQPQPPKIKAFAPEQTTGNRFERLNAVVNASESKTRVAEQEARNQPQPPKIKALPPEQTTGNKFEGFNAVENAGEGKTSVAEPEEMDEPQPPKVKAFAPEQKPGNIFERLIQIKNASEGNTSVAELEPAKQPQLLTIKALPPEQTVENKFECLIEVENESESKTAENVEVKLWKIDPLPKYASSKTDLPLRFPILPKPKSKTPGEINPKDSARFVLFNVTQTLSEVTFEIVGVEHNLKTFSHVYWEWPPHYPFPKGKPPEVLEYRITLSVSSNRYPLVKETFILECPSRWIHEKPFTLTKI